MKCPVCEGTGKDTAISNGGKISIPGTICPHCDGAKEIQNGQAWLCEVNSMRKEVFFYKDGCWYLDMEFKEESYVTAKPLIRMKKAM
jgi:RecJ-like exonuclease